VGQVAARTDSDKKGGHLARDARTGGLLLRESAQCPESDEVMMIWLPPQGTPPHTAADVAHSTHSTQPALRPHRTTPRAVDKPPQTRRPHSNGLCSQVHFGDVSKHKFFNTNNLWLDLEKLRVKMAEHRGVIPLPVMKNQKTLDPRDKNSPAVFQLETAMGAAIEAFGKDAEAILIPRSRFAPVKTTGDLLAILSDAYETTYDHRVALTAERHGVPPLIKLDNRYKFVDGLMSLIPEGAPGLLRCHKLSVEGPWVLSAGVSFEGDCKLVNKGEEPKLVAPGAYKNATIGQ